MPCVRALEHCRPGRFVRPRGQDTPDSGGRRQATCRCVLATAWSATSSWPWRQPSSAELSTIGAHDSCVRVRKARSMASASPNQAWSYRSVLVVDGSGTAGAVEELLQRHPAIAAGHPVRARRSRRQHALQASGCVASGPTPPSAAGSSHVSDDVERQPSGGSAPEKRSAAKETAATLTVVQNPNRSVCFASSHSTGASDHAIT